MSKNHTMMDLLGRINNKYIDEATQATKLSRAAGRRFSMSNVAVVVVGLAAISIVTLMAFWLSNNFGEYHTPGQNGYENGMQVPSPSPYPAETPVPTVTPAPEGNIARAHTAAQELLMQYPTIFLNLMSRSIGLDNIWDQIRSHVDYTGADFLWSWGSTMDESYLMDGAGNIITSAPFLITVDGPAIASRYFVFDEGDGIPFIIIDFHPHWVGSGRYHVYRFDGTDFVPIDSTAANWHTGGGPMEALSVQPFISDAGDLIVTIEMSSWQGSVFVSENGRLRPAAFYTFTMEHEWADSVTIFRSGNTPYDSWEEYAQLTREEFEAYRQTTAFFSIFPDMPDGDFRMLAPMPDLQAQLDADVYQMLREQTPESTLVAAPPPTPIPRTQYRDVEDNRSFDYFMGNIRETGISIVTQPQYQPFYFDGVTSSMWFNGEYWVASMYEFESVYARVMAMDQHHFWRALYSNGRFVMETNHPWLGEFFEGIP
ncbi:MAG: hypothetical protein FWC92_02930 [Defluviitaleaceae bacterium]|nr:hypothetical protein [Defluviitaleaceae bacterium]